MGMVMLAERESRPEGSQRRVEYTDFTIVVMRSLLSAICAEHCWGASQVSCSAQHDFLRLMSPFNQLHERYKKILLNSLSSPS